MSHYYEKEKLMIRMTLIDSALNMERKKSIILGIYNEEKVNQLLEQRKRIQEKIERLNKK